MLTSDHREQPGPLSLVESFIVLLCQLSYAIENQLGHHPHWGVFYLLLAGSLWHKGAYNRTFPCMEATYLLCHKEPERSKLVLYGIKELAHCDTVILRHCDNECDTMTL